MSLKRNLKNNRYIRGSYFLYKAFWGMKRSHFAQCAENAIVTPPLFL